LPGNEWYWECDWHVEIDGTITDLNGWIYGKSFVKGIKRKEPLSLDFVRRRKWIRTCYKIK
jgi:hypothetical protein